MNPSNQRTTNTWDFENRLTQVALPSGTPNTFTYNGDGQRVQKIDSTGTTKHVWDGQNILLETDGSNIIQVVYTLQPMLYGNLISQRRSGATSFYLFDGLGSTTQLANSTGSVTDSYVYDSPGNVILVNGTTHNPFKYVGKVGYYYDPDLVEYYLRARTYDPAQGRFLSRDPLGLDEEFISHNLGFTDNSYSYAVGNYVNARDPSGTAVQFYYRCGVCAGCFGALATYGGFCASGCQNAPPNQFNSCFRDCVKDAWGNTPPYARIGLTASCALCGRRCWSNFAPFTLPSHTRDCRPFPSVHREICASFW